MRVLLVFIPLFVACTPTCERLCRKTLFDCGDLDTERVALDECVTNCDRQEVLYRQWDNRDLLALFREHRRCVGGASCEDLAAGVCYEGFEELYVFDPDKTLPEQPTSSTADTGMSVR
ncbi:MAG: hypothetical protein KTR31_08245 [Myxococcales bacterium]|nr:hypothetical protein [Myxococcales bacterium]